MNQDEKFNKELEEEFIKLKTEEEQEKKKKTVVIFIIFLLALMISFGSTTYSYFNYKNKTNNTDEDDQIIIRYDGGSEYEATDVTPGWKSSAAKTFTVENIGDKKVAYDLEWTKITNNFSNPEDLLITVYKDGVMLIENQPAPVKDGDLLTDIDIKPGIVHRYEVYFYYQDSQEAQDDDLGKTFRGTFWVDVKE